MQINVNFLSDKLLSRKFTRIESSGLISYWAAHHCELEFDFSSTCLFGYLEDVAIQYIAYFTYKVVFGIDES